MRRHSISYVLLSLFVLAALSGIVTVAVAADLVQPRSAPPSLLAQFTDFLVRQRAGLSALIVLSGVAGILGGVQLALSELKRVPRADWIWRWSIRIVLAIGTVLAGGYFYHSDGGAIATAGLQLPRSECARPRQDRTTAIVLLHGWVGAADTSWNNFPKLICDDPTLADVDLYVVDYPTFLARRQLSIAELGRWLRQSFFSDSLREYSQIHIIAHSMGGPMARTMYLEDVLAGHSKIGSIITIGSPFLGAQPAELAHVLGLSEDLIIDLRPESAFLKVLANNWEALQRRPPTYCFTSPQDWIVSMGSAKYQCDCTHDYPQWGHIDMVKPTLATDERYRMPIRALRNIRLIAGAEPAARPRCFDLAESAPSLPELIRVAQSGGKGRLSAEKPPGRRM